MALFKQIIKLNQRNLFQIYIWTAQLKQSKKMKSCQDLHLIVFTQLHSVSCMYTHTYRIISICFININFIIIHTNILHSALEFKIRRRRNKIEDRNAPRIYRKERKFNQRLKSRQSCDDCEICLFSKQIDKIKKK